MISKIRITPAFALYLASIAALRSWQSCVGAAAALIAHEVGHLLAARAMGERFDRVELTPFGGVMTYAGGTIPAKGWRGAMLAAAGPAANYMMLAMLGQPRMAAMLGGELTRSMISCNAAMLLVNLLPALPLDGGRIAMCAGQAVLGTGAMIRMLTALGTAAGMGMIALGVIGGMRYGIVNVSLLIVGGYLAACAVKSRQTLAAENLYALASERGGRTRGMQRMMLYRAQADMPLYTLAGVLAGREGAALMMETQTGAILMGEDAICALMMRYPGRTLGEIAQENENFGEAAVKYWKFS